MADDRDHADSDPGVLSCHAGYPMPHDHIGGDICQLDLGLPYKPKTRQKQGAVTEKKILRGLGARQHPRSGAGRIKEDGSNMECLFEIKDANKVFALKGGELNQSFIRATQQGKDAVWIIKFGNGVKATIHVTKEA